jgi:hypothetical protein
MKKIIIIGLSIIVLAIAAFGIYYNFLRDTSEHKTLYGLWKCTSEQFDNSPAKEPVPAYLLDVSGRCEAIDIELTNGGSDITNMNEVKAEKAQCFGNRDELSFYVSNVMSGVDFKLKMDASKDTLRGTYELPQGEAKTNWQICNVVFVRVP